MEAFAAPFSTVVVYGDSLSDSGNIYALTSAPPISFPYPPSPPYAQRLSNGPVAVEYLADALGVPSVNFALGGATTGIGNSGDEGFGPATGTVTTVGSLGLPGMTSIFAATSGTLSPEVLSTGLFVVWGGANDFLAPSPLDITPLDTINRAVTNILTIVTSLQALGAVNILVPGVPDLGLTPTVLAQGAFESALASLATNLFNATLQSQLPAGVLYADTANFLRAIAADPTAFGFTNATEPCFNGVTVCANPNEYVFFDGIHPTTRTHELAAQSFLQIVVPEPSTVVSMALGLGLCIFWRRKRAAL